MNWQVLLCNQRGEQQACEDYGCPQGTTIIVKDIFYNVPARMKFLKKDTVEANAVSGVMDKIALSHPEISLRFYQRWQWKLYIHRGMDS